MNDKTNGSNLTEDFVNPFTTSEVRTAVLDATVQVQAAFASMDEIGEAVLDFIASWNPPFSAQNMADAFNVGLDISAESEECTLKELKAWRDSNLVGGGKGRQAKMRNKFNNKARKKGIK